MDFVQIPEFRLRLLDICTVEDKSWKKLMKLVVRAAKLRPTSIQANLAWMEPAVADRFNSYPSRAGPLPNNAALHDLSASLYFQ
jgi:hypothetical protein